MPVSHRRRVRHGLTLVELMVALVIGLLITVAATTVYLATASSSRVTQSVSDLGETGQLALEFLGREIKKAGFFPAQFSVDGQPLQPGSFVNTKAVGNGVFDQGVFGCEGANYNPGTKACDATVSGAPDGIVINYLASADFGDDAVIGNHRDCNRAKVSADADNAAAVAAGRPLFVSNRFGLVTTTYTAANGNTINTRSLACHGNGNEAATALTPQLAGFDDLVIRYGVYGAAANQQTPDRYYTASEVNALGLVDDLTPWQRVTSVHVCLVVRTPDAVRQAEGATARTFRDCRGNDITLSNSDRTLLRRFERVFAVRNNLRAAL
ncbi:MAG: PilW family protein [Burkholderiaceae bacterium]|nr:PilW family protein [Burkholderiaceae bacterium]